MEIFHKIHYLQSTAKGVITQQSRVEIITQARRSRNIASKRSKSSEQNSVRPGETSYSNLLGGEASLANVVGEREQEGAKP